MNDNEPPAAYWGVAVTRPNCEAMVIEALGDQAIDTYAPRFRENGREQWLFSRYLFVRVAQRWHVVLRTRGVVDLLRSGEKPAAVPDLEIDNLRAREDRAGFVRLPTLVIGAKVRILRGPMAGQFGLYRGMTGKQRESVLLSALGCKLEMQTGNLEIVE